MPVCDVCQLFYVKPQTFETLFHFKNRCHLCETYENVTLKHEVFPLDENTLECYTFDQGEHPMFTKRIFETMLSWGQPTLLFYESFWMHHPELIDLISPLFKPLRLFHYTHITHALIAFLDE